MSLHSAIEQLYQVFGPYPLRDNVDGCPCCMSAVEERDLHSTRLRDLTADQLRSFGLSALLTWGDLVDFKHFLPRLMELAAFESSQGPETESLYGRLAHGAVTSWPTQEVAAVRAFAAAHWQATLIAAIAGSADEIISGLLLIGEDMAPHLTRWDTRPTAAQHLLDFVELNQSTLIKRRLLGNAYLNGVNIPGQQQVVAWLLDPALAERHTEAYLTTSEPIHADVVAALESIAPVMSLTIDDTFSTDSGDLVVTGRVARGIISAGDHVTVMGHGANNTTTVREARTGICHSGPADAGRNVALVIDPIETRPGQLLYRDASW